jgi:hypothetical protein
MHLRPQVVLGKDEHGAIMVTIEALTVDAESNVVKDANGQPIVANREQFRIFESGFGKAYISQLAFPEGEVRPALVIDREGKRHFHVSADFGAVGAQGGEAGMRQLTPAAQ